MAIPAIDNLNLPGAALDGQISMKFLGMDRAIFSMNAQHRVSRNQNLIFDPPVVLI